MKRTLSDKFNHEVNKYKNSLLFCAKQSEWDTFKEHAGRLFDYVESIEVSEFERRFFRIFKTVLGFLLLAVIVILKMNPDMYPGLANIKDKMIVLAVAGCCFEVYFFYNFRMYMKGKTLYYKKRRQKFIYNIENDFKEMDVSTRT
jgi:hypothetical protein